MPYVTTQDPLDAVGAVDAFLRRAHELGASDVHVEPGADAVTVWARRDGVLGPLATLPVAMGPRLVGRLKALADLLAYRTDVPQEGRIDAARSGIGAEVRVATFPTVHGERAALRLDATQAGDGAGDLASLGL